MASTPATFPDRLPVDLGGLRDTVEALAGLSRLAGSPGERQAATWLAARLEDAGCHTVVEHEDAHAHYWWSVGALSLMGAGGAALSLAGRRPLGMALSALAAAGIVDDVSNGPRWFRRVALPRQRTQNVVARAGDVEAAPTLVVLAHHDASPSGVIFHPGPQRLLGQLAPSLLERLDTSVPLWWPVVGAPALGAVGALARRRRLLIGALAMGLAAAATVADVGRRPPVPGANDNLSAVACLVALAEALSSRPVSGLRVLLVSCGAEESLQEGIRAFGARHFASLPSRRTWFLVLDTVGSPQLALLEGEGTLRMHDYPSPFKEWVAGWAQAAGAPVRRNLRARSSTDGEIPRAAGYPTVTLTSVDAFKALSNYHLPSDRPENLAYETVGAAARAAEAVVRGLAREAGSSARAD